jgi:ketosteroid isomerase-like protein
MLEQWSDRPWTPEDRPGGWVIDMSPLDPEVAYEDTVLPDHASEVYRGHEGVTRAVQRWIEGFEWIVVELEQVVEVNGRFVSIHRARTKARHSGLEFESTIAYLWTFRAGKVIHFRSYLDPAQASAAAEHSEATPRC